MKKTNIAIVGATGNVGREILKILYERKFPFKTKNRTFSASGDSG